MAHLKVTSAFIFFIFHCVHVLHVFSLIFRMLLSNLFHCWHQYQSLTADVSSVVGAPWRCGVLTANGGVAGVGRATC